MSRRFRRHRGPVFLHVILAQCRNHDYYSNVVQSYIRLEITRLLGSADMADDPAAYVYVVYWHIPVMHGDLKVTFESII
jgi:hypothetical protein